MEMPNTNLPRRLFQVLTGVRRPTTSGRLSLPGLRDEVRVDRDRYGIPYVHAASDHDAFLALGFCHGQDRAFQLEALVRVVRGTLAELVGPDGLAVDRLSRRIGFRRRAAEQLAASPPHVREVVGAYAIGATLGATAGMPRPAHEFTLLRTRPTPLEPADVLGIARLISFTLAANWDSELARLRVLLDDGPEALRAVDHHYGEDMTVTAPPGGVAGKVVDLLTTDLGAFMQWTGMGGGSNNWVIAPDRTATGRPLLANDPHLAPTVPAHWYLAQVRTPAWAAAGATFVGLPAFVAGHNGVGAWGITAGMVDNTDLLLEEVGEDGRSVRRGDDWVACDVEVHTIHVKGGATVHEQVLVTPEGPIVSPALDGVPEAVSVQATWLDPAPIVGAFGLPRARDFDSAREQFRHWPVLSLNVVWADTSGSIGWQLVGEAPQRDGGTGALPSVGRDPAAGWTGRVPFDQMPHLLDPAEGFIATANNKPRADDGHPSLSADYLDGYRVERIVELLASRTDWDVAACQQLQLDVTSIPWRRMREAVLGVPVTNPDTRVGHTLLSGWDGQVTGDSAAASVFEFLVDELISRAVATKAPTSATWASGRGFHPLVPDGVYGTRVGWLVGLLERQPPGWFTRSWQDEVADALGEAVRRLRGACGDDSAAWQWGVVRPVRLPHPVGQRRPLDRIFDLPDLPGFGDDCTPAQAAVVRGDPLANTYFTPSLRLVVDVGNWEASRWALPGGQSGNPLSPHYADQLDLFAGGDGVPLWWEEDSIRRESVATLALQPEPHAPGAR